MTDFSYESTIKRYEQEVSRSQHLDQKASNQIGFAGVIMAILSFVFGSSGFVTMLSSEYSRWLFAGMGLLLLSISIGIAALTRLKKTLPVFNPEKFYDKYDKKDEPEQRRQLLLAYFDIIYDIENGNNLKAKLLYAGNVATLIGLSVSFISFLLILKVFG